MRAVGNDATIFFLHIILLFTYSLELKSEDIYGGEDVCVCVCGVCFASWLVSCLVWLVVPVCYFLTPLSLIFVSVSPPTFLPSPPSSALYLFCLGLCFVGLLCLVRCDSCGDEIDIICSSIAS